jgi:hypothetical protein
MKKVQDQLFSDHFAYQGEVLYKFNDRVKEIELFFELIELFEAVDPAQLILVDSNIHLITEHDLKIHIGHSVENTVRTLLRKLKLQTPDVDLINIFKSNSVLLLYNLLESTISNADRFILKTITNANITYLQAAPMIKKFWLKHVSKFNKNEYLNIAINLLDKIETLKIDVDKQVNDNEKEFQGNLDPKTVDELLMNYGIDATKLAMLKQETERKAVQNIVTWRNDLAHGKYSFAEFGRDKLRYNMSKKDKHRERTNDILFLKESCFIFLEIFLRNIEVYIEQSSYKIK